MEKETSVKISTAPEGAGSSHQHDSAKPTRLNFSDSSQREAHVRAFLAWLPKVLYEAPDIQWDRLPSKVMGCLMLSASHVNACVNLRPNNFDHPLVLSISTVNNP